jgi:hypothetical protein
MRRREENAYSQDLNLQNRLAWPSPRHHNAYAYNLRPRAASTCSNLPAALATFVFRTISTWSSSWYLVAFTLKKFHFKP